MHFRNRALVAAGAAALLTMGWAVPAKAIVGGSASAAGANPFMASVQSGGSHFCGGSVIGSRWVLTAAHCVPDGSAAGLSVVVGTTNNSDGSGTRITVDQVRVHPGYANNRNDAALLHLAAAAPVPAITLAGAANDNLEADGAPVTVAGWGDINPVTLGLLAGPELREVDLNVVGDAQCGADGDDVRLCAEAFLKDSCQGDSGGPLFAKVGPARVQVGIVSYGFLCAFPGSPGVYSEVNSASIRGFITSVTGI